jgi:transcriptional regulator with XRE-family HTH domain
MTQHFPGLRLTLARQMADYRERMATRIQEERKAQSLSREELASRAGVSYKTIKRIEERKVGDPRAVTIRRIAEGLKIDATELKPAVEQEESQLERIEEKMDRILRLIGEKPKRKPRSSKSAAAAAKAALPPRHARPKRQQRKEK